MIRQGASGKDAELEINLFDADGAAITAHAFVAGEVLISLPNATAALEVFGNADEANIIEKGRGRYALRLTALETATGGLVQLDLDTANGYLPHSVTERIGVVDANIDMVKGADCPPLESGRFDASIGIVQVIAAPTMQAALAVRRVDILGIGANYVDFKLNGQMGGEAAETIAATTIVGFNIVLECPSRTLHDASYPQTRQIITWTDLGGGVGRATVHRAWSPALTGALGPEGDYFATLWPAGALPSEIQDGLATSVDIDAVATDIIALQTDVDTMLANQEILLGLLHHNAVVDEQVWTGKDLIGFRVRKFASVAEATAASIMSIDGADGEIRRFFGEATYSATGKPNRFMITEDPV